jgi:hypothetical protein
MMNSRSGSPRLTQDQPSQRSPSTRAIESVSLPANEPNFSASSRYGSGERVVDVIRNKTFYAFVNAVPADVVKARHRRIEAAPETRWTMPHYSPATVVLTC